jgi:hypothetical protein
LIPLFFGRKPRNGDIVKFAGISLPNLPAK